MVQQATHALVADVNELGMYTCEHCGKDDHATPIEAAYCCLESD